MKNHTIYQSTRVITTKCVPKLVLTVVLLLLLLLRLLRSTKLKKGIKVCDLIAFRARILTNYRSSHIEERLEEYRRGGVSSLAALIHQLKQKDTAKSAIKSQKFGNDYISPHHINNNQHTTVLSFFKHFQLQYNLGKTILQRFSPTNSNKSIYLSAYT